MAAEFPAAIKNFTDPSNTSRQNAPVHSQQHIDVNAEVEAIEGVLGVNLGNVLKTTMLDLDTTLSANSDSKIPSQKAVKSYADGLVVGAGGVPIGYLDTDVTLAANSDTKIATQKATKAYVDGKTSVYASQEEAEAGTIETKDMNPLRTNQAIAALKSLGDYASKTTDTAYQAATDGFVVAYRGAGTDASINGLIGASNPPTTLVISGDDSGNGRTPICFPVKKDMWWTVQNASGVVNWVPLGV